MKRNQTLRKPEVERSFFNVMKGIYGEPTANITLCVEKLHYFPLILETRQRSPLTPTFSNIAVEVLFSATKHGQEIKCMQIVKEEVKLSLVTDDIIVSVQNLKKSGRNY